MSPRKNRRTPQALRRLVGGARWTEGDWIVRSVAGAAKTYRCPGCDQEIHPGVGHVVAWPVGDADERRHWHRPCWEHRRERKPSRRTR